LLFIYWEKKNLCDIFQDIIMVNRSNLEESSVVGVTATILVFSSLLSLYLLARNAFNYRYPAAQGFLFIIYSLPSFIGWCAWEEILNHDRSRGLEFLMSIFKAFVLVSFLAYSYTMLGITTKDGKLLYSEEQKVVSIC
jgi:hypothetical protein